MRVLRGGEVHDQLRRAAERADLRWLGTEQDGMPAGPGNAGEYRQDRGRRAVLSDRSDGHAAHSPDHLAEDRGDAPVHDDHGRGLTDRRAQAPHRICLVRPDAMLRQPAGCRPEAAPGTRVAQAEAERGADRGKQHRPHAERAHDCRCHRPSTTVPGPAGQPGGSPGGQQDKPGNHDGNQPPARPWLVGNGERLP